MFSFSSSLLIDFFSHCIFTSSFCLRESQSDHRATSLVCFRCVTFCHQFGPKIQIKYIDTEKQLADILTKGSFTCDEWNHLLCLFNVDHFSSTVCSETMATISTRFRRRTSHSKIVTNDELLSKGAVERIILDFSKSGEEKLRKSRSLEFNG